MSVDHHNSLAESQSPYLLQHAGNPVHWFPWGDEAFEAAKREDKPVFLSIGYATCHWCHVMAHESFEDEAVADLMNDAFINIKVDREERPDIDNTYMHVAQMLTGRGGWPLTIIMTPDKKPFYAATYIPKNSRQGQPGMLDLIPRTSHLWNNEREEITGSAEEITQAFQQSIQPTDSNPLPDNILDTAFSQLKQNFDSVHGGFGSAPKFPTPHTLVYLLRYGHQFDEPDAISMAEQTLTSMRRGGIFDHVGGGFHRYSTDPKWLLPHFEKMLYDQAMHLAAYTEAWQLTHNPLFRQTVEEITTYLFQDLQHKDGAFFSAEDADSEGEEGTFYVWSVNEVREILPAADTELIIEVFNLQEAGNYADESTRQRRGKNILHRTKSIDELAREREMEPDALRQTLHAALKKMNDVRETRERPFLDDKILTDWNGLIIAALAKAGRIFNNPEYIDEAKRAADFIFGNLSKGDDTLLHRWRNGEAAIKGTADDYAFFIWGLIELYEATFETNYLQKAIGLNEQFLDSHWDEQAGAFHFTGEGNEALLGRKKEFLDSALPSGNSLAAMNLLRLGRITSQPEWEEKAERLARATADMVKRSPTSFTQLLQAHLWATQTSFEVVIAGKKKNQDLQDMKKRLDATYLPHAVVLLHDERNAKIQSLAPFLKHQTMQNGKATAYVCRNYACEEPTNNPEKMLELLTENQSRK